MRLNLEEHFIECSTEAPQIGALENSFKKRV